MSEIIHPLVHLNGTSRRELLAQRRDLDAALTTARDALFAAFPQPRDFYIYVRAEARWVEAEQQFARRVKVLDDLIEEIGAEIAKLTEDAK